MTAHAMKGDRERCLEAGMDGYVSKPLQVEALYAAVEGRATEPPAGAEPPLDLQTLRKHFGDDALLKEVAGVFLESCPAWQTEIRDAVAAHDASRICAIAHTIKGAVSHFDAIAAYEAANELEQMGRDRQLAGAATTLTHLDRALVRLQSALRAIC
jgi:HPt (histidine-containing phosphotransfer) domain-containing protein